MRFKEVFYKNKALKEMKGDPNPQAWLVAYAS